MALFGIGSDYKNTVYFMAGQLVIDAGGELAPTEFELMYYTSSEKKSVVASLKGGVYTNCELQGEVGNKHIVVAFDKPPFTAGQVICKASLTYPDALFPDTFRTHVMYIETQDEYDKL